MGLTTRKVATTAGVPSAAKSSRGATLEAAPDLLTAAPPAVPAEYGRINTRIPNFIEGDTILSSIPLPLPPNHPYALLAVDTTGTCAFQKYPDAKAFRGLIARW